MKQVDIDDKLHFSPVYQQDRRFPALFLSTELIPKMTSHDGSSSAWLFLHGMASNEKYWRDLLPVPSAFKKKKRETLATVATKLSYCQCEHISTQIADKHAATAIKQRLNI